MAAIGPAIHLNTTSVPQPGFGDEVAIETSLRAANPLRDYSNGNVRVRKAIPMKLFPFEPKSRCSSATRRSCSPWPWQRPTLGMSGKHRP